MIQPITSKTKHTMTTVRHISIFVLLLSCALPTFAAEIQLREVCHISGSVVRISDIADVYDANPTVAKRLADTELFPAPVRGSRRTLAPRQIRDHLARAGWNLLEHRISGASQVVIHADEKIRLASSALSAGRPISAVAVKNAHQRIEQLLQDALRKNDAKDQDAINRKVKFELTEPQSRLIAQNRHAFRVARPIPAGSGDHRVELVAATDSDKTTNASRIALSVHVEEPHAVVVARRALPKGKLISHDDVELKYTETNGSKRTAATRLEDIVGKEAVTRLDEGQPIDSRRVRRRILIRSGSLVTVYARASGIQVRATAKARESGARDDVIWVESSETRKKYSARVIDVDTVEVLAQSATVGRKR
jgi:flagella basal body P-ring formation protein FlgA